MLEHARPLAPLNTPTPSVTPWWEDAATPAASPLLGAGGGTPEAASAAFGWMFDDLAPMMAAGVGGVKGPRIPPVTPGQKSGDKPKDQPGGGQKEPKPKPEPKPEPKPKPKLPGSKDEFEPAPKKPPMSWFGRPPQEEIDRAHALQAGGTLGTLGLLLAPELALPGLLFGH